MIYEFEADNFYPSYLDFDLYYYCLFYWKKKNLDCCCILMGFLCFFFSTGHLNGLRFCFLSLPNDALSTYISCFIRWSCSDLANFQSNFCHRILFLIQSNFISPKLFIWYKNYYMQLIYVSKIKKNLMDFLSLYSQFTSIFNLFIYNIS